MQFFSSQEIGHQCGTLAETFQAWPNLHGGSNQLDDV